MDKEVFRILEENDFFGKDVKKPIVVVDSLKDIANEGNNNCITLYLPDAEKEIVTVNDLKEYLDIILSEKRKELRRRNIKKTLLLRIWHDVADDWLRYTIVSRYEKEIEMQRKEAKRRGLFMVDNVNEVFQSFLDSRSNGFYKRDAEGNKFFRNNEIDAGDEFLSEEEFDEKYGMPWKMYEEEVTPLELNLIK